MKLWCFDLHILATWHSVPNSDWNLCNLLLMPWLHHILDIKFWSCNSGGIGENFTLGVDCTINTNGQNPLLPVFDPIPDLPLPLRVELCPQGTEPRGIICQPCPLNFFNYDQTGCKPCPEGKQISSWFFLWHQLWRSRNQIKPFLKLLVWIDLLLHDIWAKLLRLLNSSCIKLLNKGCSYN